MSRIQTPLAKARGTGSSHHGAHHWWMQRLTALANIPLVVWFVVTSVGAIIRDQNIVSLLDSPVNAILFILLFVSILYHSTLGMQVVFEDYVSCKVGRTFLIIVTKLLGVGIAIAVSVAIIYAHLGKDNVSAEIKKQHQYRSDYNAEKSEVNELTSSDNSLVNNNSDGMR